MLLRHLYLISLEDQLCWPMWFGLPVNETSCERFHAGYVGPYISGLTDSVRVIDPTLDDLSPFFVWLRDDLGEFPARGWCAHYLDQCNGDHFHAVAKLFGYMYDYILLDKPIWFIELNQIALPSQVINGRGDPRSSDIRKLEHIVACESAG